MRKDQQEELRRLEEALLAPEEDTWQPEEADSDQWLEAFYDDTPEDFEVYNTDTTDVDLESFSDDVQRGRRGGGCLVPLVILLTALLCALVGFLLWKQGVIPWAP